MQNNLVITDCEQSAKVKLLEFCNTISYYRNQVNLKMLDNTQTLSQILSQLPIIDKQQLLEHGSALYQLPESMIMLLSETSGTSSQVHLPTPRSQEEMRWNSNNQAVAYAHHIKSGIDRLAIYHPTIMSPFAEASGFALKSLGVGYMRLFPIPKICDYARIVQTLTQHKITAIMSTPSLIAKLLYEKNKMHKLIDWHIDKILLTGEVITPAKLAMLDKLLGKKQANRLFVYGSSEAATCMFGNKNGLYTPFIKDFIFEVIPSTAHSTLPSKSNATVGRLCITWLQSGVRPLIRYDTGDNVIAYRINNTYQFKMLGRTEVIDKSGASLDQERLDTVILNPDFAIYHYSLMATDNKLTLDLIIDDNGDKTRLETYYETVRNALQQYLGGEISIQVNREEHDFMQFSIPTKLKLWYTQ